MALQSTVEGRPTDEADNSSQLRRIGKTVLELAQAEAAAHPRNNDPLAPVLHEMDDRRFFIEFVTDMGERSKNQHFYESFQYKIVGNDLLSDTGLSQRQMLNDGWRASAEDVKRNPANTYTHNRHEVQMSHTDILLSHHASGDRRSIWFSSMCPEEWELPAEPAEAANFRQDRLMSSNWLFEPTDDGYVMHVFSLDNHDLTAQHQIFSALGVKNEVASTTLDQLGQAVVLDVENGAEAVELIRAAHDDRLNQKQPGSRHNFGINLGSKQTLEAMAMVRTKPKAFELWKAVCGEMRSSLMDGKVSGSLAAIAADMRGAFMGVNVPPHLKLFEGQSITADEARNFMQYLRRQAIPHYIYSPKTQSLSAEAEFAYEDYGGGGGDIAAAGAEASLSGISYDSACPDSGSGDQAAANGPSAHGGGAEDDLVARSYGFKRGELPNNFGKPKRGVCRTSSCVSRGSDPKDPEATLVGGCDLCITCHHLAASKKLVEYEQWKMRREMYSPKAADIIRGDWQSIVIKDRQDRQQKIEDELSIRRREKAAGQVGGTGLSFLL